MDDLAPLVILEGLTTLKSPKNCVAHTNFFREFSD